MRASGIAKRHPFNSDPLLALPSLAWIHCSFQKEHGFLSMFAGTFVEALKKASRTDLKGKPELA